MRQLVVIVGYLQSIHLRHQHAKESTCPEYSQTLRAEGAYSLVIFLPLEVAICAAAAVVTTLQVVCVRWQGNEAACELTNACMVRQLRPRGRPCGTSSSLNLEVVRFERSGCSIRKMADILAWLMAKSGVGASTRS